MPVVLLLFILVPIIEIAFLIQVGSAIGGWTTIGIVIITAILGTAMLRQQGLATLAKAQQSLSKGELKPVQQMLEGLILLVGGVLLLTPGFITDGFGFFCLIPVTRGWLADKLAARSMSFINVAGGPSPFGHHGPGSGMGSRSGAGQDSGGPSFGLGPDAAGNSNEVSSGNGSSNGEKTAPKRPSEIIDGDYKHLE